MKDLTIRPRKDWTERAPRSVTPQSVADSIYLHHSANKQPIPAGASFAAAALRGFQRFHMDEQGWSDIAYSHGVDQAGECWHLRGADRRPGATKDHNKDSLAILVIGNFQTETPTPAAIETVAKLCSWYKQTGKSTTDQITGGHREFSKSGTLCPGDNLQKLIPVINQRILDLDPSNVAARWWPPHAEHVTVAVFRDQVETRYWAARKTSPPAGDVDLWVESLKKNGDWPGHLTYIEHALANEPRR